ncbi:hypothetical protein [Embleya sp. NPDC005971]|uniref:hypothetical protein n=1 Tax=Embleya sp. NPDC005971 TaxID=3156724 RepID=UPI0033CCB865
MLLVFALTFGPLAVLDDAALLDSFPSGVLHLEVLREECGAHGGLVAQFAGAAAVGGGLGEVPLGGPLFAVDDAFGGGDVGGVGLGVQVLPVAGRGDEFGAGVGAGRGLPGLGPRSRWWRRSTAAARRVASSSARTGEVALRERERVEDEECVGSGVLALP